MAGPEPVSHSRPRRGQQTRRRADPSECPPQPPRTRPRPRLQRSRSPASRNRRRRPRPPESVTAPPAMSEPEPTPVPVPVPEPGPIPIPRTRHPDPGSCDTSPARDSAATRGRSHHSRQHDGLRPPAGHPPHDGCEATSTDSDPGTPAGGQLRASGPITAPTRAGTTTFTSGFGPRWGTEHQASTSPVPSAPRSMQPSTASSSVPAPPPDSDTGSSSTPSSATHRSPPSTDTCSPTG